MDRFLLSSIIIIPFIGAFLQIFLTFPQSRRVAFIFSSCASILTLYACWYMQTLLQPHLAFGNFQEHYAWMEPYAIYYSLGLDGWNATMILLAAILFPLILLHSGNKNHGSGTQGCFGLLLLIQSCSVGMALAADLFLQTFFSTLLVLWFTLLINIWGKGNTKKSAFRYFIVANLSNFFMFFALILIYAYSLEHNFLVKTLASSGFGMMTFPWSTTQRSAQEVIFLLLTLSFFFKIPFWPWHGWMHTFVKTAPTSVLVAFVSVFIPISLSVFTRNACMLFSQTLQNALPWLLSFGALNIVMGSLAAMYQTTFRGVLHYFCLFSIGLMFVGIAALNALGLLGSIFQSFIFGLNFTALAFLFEMLEQRQQNPWHDLEIGWDHSKTPRLMFLGSLVIVCSTGLPGMGGFIGNLLISFGVYQRFNDFVIFLFLFLLILCVGVLRLYQMVFLKTASTRSSIADLSLLESSILSGLVLGSFIFGWLPFLLMQFSTKLIQNLSYLGH